MAERNPVTLLSFLSNAPGSLYRVNRTATALRSCARAGHKSVPNSAGLDIGKRRGFGYGFVAIRHIEFVVNIFGVSFYICTFLFKQRRSLFF